MTDEWNDLHLWQKIIAAPYVALQFVLMLSIPIAVLVGVALLMGGYWTCAYPQC